MKRRHSFETSLASAVLATLRAAGWRRSLTLGAALGDLARHLGLRRRVAESNLALAFPELSEARRARILRGHYRELGKVLAEYARLDELAQAPLGRVIVQVHGLEHLMRAREAGRGALLLSGHFGNIELLGAHLGTLHPVDFVVRPFSNPGVEAMMERMRQRAGVGLIDANSGVRRVYEALRANRWVAVLADQDARQQGVFVPFMGRLASTPVGPARIALATGAALVMGFDVRRPDDRHELEIDPPLTVDDPSAPDAAVRLTALHAARLEHHVRQRPELWFWLHRRWKTPAPAAVETPQPVALERRG